MNCKICNTPSKTDLFAHVTQAKVCSICTVRFIGGLPATQERIDNVRQMLGLKEGEFLQ